MEISKKRYELFCAMMEEIDLAGRLMDEYDSLPHEYSGEVLYQVESHVIQVIGRNPGTTVTEIAQMLGKTTSACSQCIKKLRKKDWIKQIRNEENNRQYNLYLTELGWDIFQKHEQFDQMCYERKCEILEDFSDEELETYLAIQKKINEGFLDDVKFSKASFQTIDEKK